MVDSPTPTGTDVDGHARDREAEVPAAEDVPEPRSRRERQRRELIDELCAEAARQLAVGGAGSVTWRGLARAVGMSPASLYTYFDSLDALFTELILRTYASLAAATRAGVEHFADPADRMLAGIHAYRHWALTHRAEFNLIFTDQLPGYTAEPGGATVDAQVAVFEPLIEAARQFDADGSPTAMLGVWGMFHGLVSLEVNHHLDWLDAAPQFDLHVRNALEEMGFPSPSTDVAAVFAVD